MRPSFLLAIGHKSAHDGGITDIDLWHQWLRDAPALPPNRGPAMSISDHHHSGFEARQLTLFGAAVIVLLVFACTCFIPERTFEAAFALMLDGTVR